MNINDLEVYQIALKIGDLAWKVYRALPKELAYKMGSQFLRSSDSIGANIAEGYGRFHYKDSAKFYYNSRGSLYETAFWINRLKYRGLINQNDEAELTDLITTEIIKLNKFIKSVNIKAYNQ
jgi:four helix bundle protein